MSAMAVDVKIQIDQREINRIKERIAAVAPDKVERIFVGAVKRAGTAAKTMSAKAISGMYTLPSKKSKEDMRLIYQGMNAEFRITGYQRDVKEFKVRPAFRLHPKGAMVKAGTPKPPHVTLKKGEGGPISDAFWAQMSSGHQNLYRRQGDEPLPINDVPALAVAQMGDQAIEREQVQARIMEVLNERVDHALKRALEGK